MIGKWSEEGKKSVSSKEAMMCLHDSSEVKENALGPKALLVCIIGSPFPQ